MLSICQCFGNTGISQNVQLQIRFHLMKLHLVSLRFFASSVPVFLSWSEMYIHFNKRYFYKALIIFIGILVVILKSQEGFSMSDIFILCLLLSQCSFYLFLVISLLLYCKAIPILFIPAIMFIFSLSFFFFNGKLVGYFSFSSDFRLFQSSPL